MQDSKFAARWERTRQKGKCLYIAQYCIVMVTSTLIGITIAHTLTGKISLDITIGVIIGELIGGIVGGFLRWNANEEKYISRGAKIEKR